MKDNNSKNTHIIQKNKNNYFYNFKNKSNNSIKDIKLLQQKINNGEFGASIIEVGIINSKYKDFNIERLQYKVDYDIDFTSKKITLYDPNLYLGKTLLIRRLTDNKTFNEFSESKYLNNGKDFTIDNVNFNSYDFIYGAQYIDNSFYYKFANMYHYKLEFDNNDYLNTINLINSNSSFLSNINNKKDNIENKKNNINNFIEDSVLYFDSALKYINSEDNLNNFTLKEEILNDYILKLNNSSEKLIFQKWGLGELLMLNENTALNLKERLIEANGEVYNYDDIQVSYLKDLYEPEYINNYKLESRLINNYYNTNNLITYKSVSENTDHIDSPNSYCYLYKDKAVFGLMNNSFLPEYRNSNHNNPTEIFQTNLFNIINSGGDLSELTMVFWKRIEENRDYSTYGSEYFNTYDEYENSTNFEPEKRLRPIKSPSWRRPIFDGDLFIQKKINRDSQAETLRQVDYFINEDIFTIYDLNNSETIVNERTSPNNIPHTLQIFDMSGINYEYPFGYVGNDFQNYLKDNMKIKINNCSSMFKESKDRDTILIFADFYYRKLVNNPSSSMTFQQMTTEEKEVCCIQININTGNVFHFSKIPVYETNSIIEAHPNGSSSFDLNRSFTQFFYYKRHKLENYSTFFSNPIINSNSEPSHLYFGGLRYDSQFGANEGLSSHKDHFGRDLVYYKSGFLNTFLSQTINNFNYGDDFSNVFDNKLYFMIRSELLLIMDLDIGLTSLSEEKIQIPNSSDYFSFGKIEKSFTDSNVLTMRLGGSTTEVDISDNTNYIKYKDGNNIFSKKITFYQNDEEFIGEKPLTLGNSEIYFYVFNDFSGSYYYRGIILTHIEGDYFLLKNERSGIDSTITVPGNEFYFSNSYLFNFILKIPNWREDEDDINLDFNDLKQNIVGVFPTKNKIPGNPQASFVGGNSTFNFNYTEAGVPFKNHLYYKNNRFYAFGTNFNKLDELNNEGNIKLSILEGGSIPVIRIPNKENSDPDYFKNYIVKAPDGNTISGTNLKG